MSQNCKYLKQKINRKLYCKKIKKEIKISNCSNCIYKEYNRFPIKGKTINKSKRLAKLERNRSSILTDDLDKCFIPGCGKVKEDLHEIYPGRNRLNSIKYGLVLPLCREHHILIHNDLNTRLIYFKLGQKKFNEVYPELDFVEIFKRNYL